MLLNLPSKNVARTILSVRENNLRFTLRNCTQPIQEILLAGVRAESSQRVNLRAYSYRLAVNSNDRLPIHNAAAQRVLSLISDKENVCFFSP